MKQSLLMPLNTAGLHKQMLSVKELNHTGTNFKVHGVFVCFSMMGLICFHQTYIKFFTSRVEASLLLVTYSGQSSEFVQKQYPQRML